jgi:hypothetical protein
MPLTKCGTTLARNRPPKKYDTRCGQFIVKRSLLPAG